jgi:Flp pilus assembly CpaE family ATPase
MTTAILIAPSPDLADYLESLCPGLGEIRIARTIHTYPPAYEITQALASTGTDLLLLELGLGVEALQTVQDVRVTHPQMCIVGFAPIRDDEEIHKAQEAGVDEVLFAPFSEEDLKQALTRAAGARRALTQGEIVAFLPAKAGNGASTTALHFAGTLAQAQQKVLLLDADLHSSVLALALNLNPAHSILDALDNAADLSDALWSTFICQAHGIDTLGPPLTKKVRMFSPWDYRRVIGFATERYGFVIADLPEVVNDATEAVVGEAKHVFVVCTPELPSLFLARRRIHELRTRGVNESAIGVILNRCVSREVQVAEAERVVERTLSAVLPNDYAGVQEALREARPLQDRTEIAKAFAVFARQFLPPPRPSERERKPAAGLLSRWLG